MEWNDGERKVLGLAKAIERISQQLDLSSDVAIDKLIEAASAGTVRSTGESALWGHRRREIQFFWHSRSSLVPTKCNLRNDSIWNRAEGEITRVTLDFDDLNNWLRGLDKLGKAEADPALQRTSVEKIRKAIAAAYDEADQKGEKPPNVVELPAIVNARLVKEGTKAPTRQIQQLASDFKDRRRKAGRTVASERSRQR
jgi:hypothetical protein